MKKIVLLALLFSKFGFANSVDDVKISTIMSNNTLGERIYIKISPSKPNGCPTTGSYPYRLDTSTEIGKLMASQILAAYMAEKMVKLVGTGECTGGNAEILKEVVLK